MSPSPVFIAKFFALICANLISCVISFLCSQLTAALAALKLRRVAPPHPPIWCLLPLCYLLPLPFSAHFWHSAVVCLEANFVNNSAHNIENLLLLRKKGHTEWEKKPKEWVEGATAWHKQRIIMNTSRCRRNCRKRGWLKGGVSAFQCVTLTKFFFPLFHLPTTFSFATTRSPLSPFSFSHAAQVSRASQRA